jgi:hypothetical protein
MPQVLKFVEEFQWNFSGTLTSVQVNTMSIKECLSQLEKKKEREMKDLFNMVSQTWNVIRSRIARYECEAVELPLLSIEVCLKRSSSTCNFLNAFFFSRQLAPSFATSSMGNSFLLSLQLCVRYKIASCSIFMNSLPLPLAFHPMETSIPSPLTSMITLGQMDGGHTSMITCVPLTYTILPADNLSGT